MTQWQYNNHGEIYRLAKKLGKVMKKNDELRARVKPQDRLIFALCLGFSFLILITGVLCFYAGYQLNELEHFIEQDSYNSLKGVPSEVSGGSGEERQATSSLRMNVPNLAGDTFEGIITAYTTHDEGVNCTSASGKNLCQSTGNYCACPSRYEFGTKFLIDDKVWICQDRMAERYRDGNYFDLFYYDDLESAYRFGRQTLEVIEL